MTIQTTPRARLTDPTTSHEAADSVRKVTETHDRILAMLYRPSTDEEIYGRHLAAFGYISASGCRTRRKELVDLGLVIDSGLRSTTVSGRKTIVWRLP